MNAELMMLQLRNLIATREMNTATANRELSLGGWLCNRDEYYAELALEIDALSKQLEAMFSKANEVFLK